MSELETIAQDAAIHAYTRLPWLYVGPLQRVIHDELLRQERDADEYQAQMHQTEASNAR